MTLLVFRVVLDPNLFQLFSLELAAATFRGVAVAFAASRGSPAGAPAKGFRTQSAGKTFFWCSCQKVQNERGTDNDLYQITCPMNACGESRVETWD